MLSVLRVTLPQTSASPGALGIFRNADNVV